jgi:hypothetical protein
MAQGKNDSKSQGKVQGEGDYEAGRRYDEKAREFVKNNDVDQAARDAEPASQAEQRDMEQAEEQGKSRAKEEDRLLDRPEKVDSGKGGGSGPKR